MRNNSAPCENLRKYFSLKIEVFVKRSEVEGVGQVSGRT